MFKMNDRLRDFVNEGKYAKYLTKAKKKKHVSAPANKEYKEQFKIFKKKLTELNKAVDRHIALQQVEPLEYRNVGEIQEFNDHMDAVLHLIGMRTKK